MPQIFELPHVLLLIPFLVLFFVPTWIAGRRRAEHYWWIGLSNLVVAGTGVGWVVVLIWALHDRPRTLPFAASGPEYDR